MPRLRVFCLRHAESENAIGGVAGAVPSAPLTATGHEQAAAAARMLANEPIRAVYCSTALRARQTAATFGRPVIPMDELVEVGIGTHEGSTDPAVRAETAAVLRAWIVDRHLDRRVADGETGHDVLRRMHAAFERIADSHDRETVVVVGHVGALTTGVEALCGLGAGVWGTPLPHAAPFLVERNGQTWGCPSWPNLSMIR